MINGLTLWHNGFKLFAKRRLFSLGGIPGQAGSTEHDVGQRGRCGTGLCGRSLSFVTKQIPHIAIVIDGHMQVDAGDGNAGMTCGVSDLGQRASASQSVANKSVPAMVNGEGFEPGQAQHLAGRQEPPANGVTLQRLPIAMSLHRTDERIMATGAIFDTPFLPRRQVGQRSAIPPQRHTTRLMPFGGLASQPQIGPRDLHDHIVELQAADFRDAQSATAGKPDNDQVPPAVFRAPGLVSVIGKNLGQFAAGQETGLIEIPAESSAYGFSEVRATWAGTTARSSASTT